MIHRESRLERKGHSIRKRGVTLGSSASPNWQLWGFQQNWQAAFLYWWPNIDCQNPWKRRGERTCHFWPKLKKILKLDCVLPAWGLTAKVRTGSRGGRVLFSHAIFELQPALLWSTVDSKIKYQCKQEISQCNKEFQHVVPVRSFARALKYKLESDQSPHLWNISKEKAKYWM